MGYSLCLSFKLITTKQGLIFHYGKIRKATVLASFFDSTVHPVFSQHKQGHQTDEDFCSLRVCGNY